MSHSTRPFSSLLRSQGLKIMTRFTEPSGSRRRRGTPRKYTPAILRSRSTHTDVDISDRGGRAWQELCQEERSEGQLEGQCRQSKGELGNRTYKVHLNAPFALHQPCSFTRQRERELPAVYAGGISWPPFTSQAFWIHLGS